MEIVAVWQPDKLPNGITQNLKCWKWTSVFFFFCIRMLTEKRPVITVIHYFNYTFAFVTHTECLGKTTFGIIILILV